MSKDYIGDGVYVTDDGYQIELTGNAAGRENTIYLDSRVFDAFLRFVERARGVKITVGKADKPKDGDNG